MYGNQSVNLCVATQDAINWMRAVTNDISHSEGAQNSGLRSIRGREHFDFFGKIPSELCNRKTCFYIKILFSKLQHF